MAPFIIFGGMLMIGVSTTGAVLITHCQGDQNLMNPVLLKPGRQQERRQPIQMPTKQTNVAQDAGLK
jgi:hypothetical protein